MKRCLTCSAVRDMHIKTALRFHLAPVRMLSLGRQMTGTPGRDVGKEEPLFNAGGLQNGTATAEISVEASQ